MARWRCRCRAPEPVATNGCARLLDHPFHRRPRGRRRKPQAFLAELFPSLAIADRCTLSDRYLTVRGSLRTYRIHLGSGNILMEDDRYLCIVPAAVKEDASAAFLPFEGDSMLSLILSKAVMLVADDKIKDARILSQLRR